MKQQSHKNSATEHNNSKSFDFCDGKPLSQLYLWTECMSLIRVSSSVFYFCILRFLFICNLYSGYDHCTDCPSLVEDANSDLMALVYNVNSVARRLCGLFPKKENCLLATDTVKEILRTLVDEMFPTTPTEESNLLTCSHLLFMCPDKDSKGKEIESGAWSCSSCELFLNHLFTILNTPLPKVNKAMTSILCPTKDADCVNVFTDVFQISGIFGEFIRNKRTAPAVCKVVKCIN